jgi:hypothetical protein
MRRWYFPRLYRFFEGRGYNFIGVCETPKGKYNEGVFTWKLGLRRDMLPLHSFVPLKHSESLIHRKCFIFFGYCDYQTITLKKQ